MNSGIKSFDRRQTHILLICFIVYFCAYIGRLNMSATLEDIMAEFTNLTKAASGLLQTVFAVTYAAGQLVFGTLSDRIRPKRLIVTGLAGSAACNVLFSLMKHYELMVAMWTLNGVFQSMIWTPIVLYMAHTFRPEQRKSASFVMSFTLAAGHFAAWGIAIKLSELLSWRYSYRIPALVLLFAAGLALVRLPGGLKGKDGGSRNVSDERAPLGKLLKTGLVFMLLCCLANGFVRDGVITWAPTIIGADSRTAALIIPCINLLGILLGAFLVRRVKFNIRALVGLMMLAVGALSLVLSVFSGAAVFLLALLLGMISALLYGSNPLLTTLVPMQYDKMGRVGLVAGLIDSFIYLGSALAGSVTGWLEQLHGTWRTVYVFWCLAAAVGFVMAMISAKQKSLSEVKQQ